MILLALGISLLLIVVLALLFIGAGVEKTNNMPDQIIIDVYEAIEYCAQALPNQTTASLSYDELRKALRLHLEWLQAHHWAPEHQQDAIVFQTLDPLDYVLERADITGLNIHGEQAAQIIEAHMSYLESSGAIHIDDPALVEKDLAHLPILLESTEEKHGELSS